MSILVIGERQENLASPLIVCIGHPNTKKAK
jgi:hypothetical protein